MGNDNKPSLFHYPPRPRDVKRGDQPLHPGEFEQFIRNKMGFFRSNPPGQNQYDKEEDVYKPKHETAREDLQKILGAYDEESGTSLKINKCSWGTVFKHMEEAARLQSSKGQTSEPALQVGVEMASEIIDLFPEEFGLGVLKGGLALVFKACQRHSESRQKIMDAFQSVPDVVITINTAYGVLGPQTDDEELYKNFFATLLEDLPFLIQKLLGEERWYKKIASALLLHIPEQLAVDDILSKWATKMTGLTNRVERMKIRILGDLRSKINDVEAHMDLSKNEVIGVIRESRKDQEAFEQAVLNPETGIMALWRQSNELHERMMTQTQQMNGLMAQNAAFRADQASAATLTGLIREMQVAYQRDKATWDQERHQFHRVIKHIHENEDRERHDKEFYRHENDRLQQYIRRKQVNERANDQATPRASITPMRLLGAIGVPVETRWRDLDFVARQCIHFDAESQGKAQWLIKTPDFSAWMRDRQSSILLADGATTGHILLVSPMSGLCGALASEFSDEDGGTITLVFFAGLHVGTDRKDRNLDGPQGLMRSLVAQLLGSSLSSPNLDFLTHEDLEEYRRHNIRSLCQLFVRLVEQMPPGTDIFCILDGISWYEQHPWLAELKCVTSMFEKLAENLDPSHAAILKVIMTSHGTSTKIVHRARATRNLKGQIWRHVSLAAGHVHPGIDNIANLQRTRQI